MIKLSMETKLKIGNKKHTTNSNPIEKGWQWGERKIKTRDALNSKQGMQRKKRVRHAVWQSKGDTNQSAE